MNTILLITGLLSIYFGYRLFCNMSRRALSTVSGAALAILGMAILVGEAKAFVAHGKQPAPAARRSTNWHNGAAPSSHHRQHLLLIA